MEGNSTKGATPRRNYIQPKLPNTESNPRDSQRTNQTNHTANQNFDFVKINQIKQTNLSERVGGVGEFEGERGATSQLKPPLPFKKEKVCKLIAESLEKSDSPHFSHKRKKSYLYIIVYTSHTPNFDKVKINKIKFPNLLKRGEGGREFERGGKQTSPFKPPLSPQEEKTFANQILESPRDSQAQNQTQEIPNTQSNIKPSRQIFKNQARKQKH